MAAINPLSGLRSRMAVSLIGCIFLAGSFFLSPCPARAGTIVLDPGHGGNDGGAWAAANLPKSNSPLRWPRTSPPGWPSTPGRTDPDRGYRSGAGGSGCRGQPPAGRFDDQPPRRRGPLLQQSHGRRLFPQRGTALVTSGDFDPGAPQQDWIPDRPAWARLQIRHQHQSQHLANAIQQALIHGGNVRRGYRRQHSPGNLDGRRPAGGAAGSGLLAPDGRPLTSQQFQQQLSDGAEPIAAAIETAAAELAR